MFYMDVEAMSVNVVLQFSAGWVMYANGYENSRGENDISLYMFLFFSSQEIGTFWKL